MKPKKLLCAGLIATSLIASNSALAGTREQAQRIHDRLVGSPASVTTLDAMETEIRDNSDPIAAAHIAMGHDNFYNVTLKNFVTPWTNQEQDVFADLNDYSATVIGIVRDNYDFRRMLYDNIIYTAPVSVTVNGVTTNIPTYNNDNNNHYATLEDSGASLQSVLIEGLQSNVTGLDTDATSGVLTSRAAAHAFFIAGTNRAMFRFTLMNHMCTDLEQVKDTTRIPDRVRQDVSRSPGGDSRLFNNQCIGCHSGMDPLAGAFAYYEFNGVEGEATGVLEYNSPGETDPVSGTRVTAKHLINSTNFPHGYITADDSWINYWRAGPNRKLGWDFAPDSVGAGSGNGASSMARELADSKAFAQCQVTKVFRTTCLREPQDANDRARIESMTQYLANNGYNIKDVFARSAEYCMGN